MTNTRTLFAAIILAMPNCLMAQVQQGGQQPAAPPSLSATENAAIQQLRAKQVELQKMFADIDGEYRKNHPGFMISPLTLMPEALPQPPATPPPDKSKPEVKKDGK